MKIIDTRERIRRAIAQQVGKVGCHGKENLSKDAHGRAVIRMSELDPESVTADEVATAYELMGVGGDWLTPLCDECERRVPLVVELEAHGHEADGAWICPECLAKAAELVGAAVPA